MLTCPELAVTRDEMARFLWRFRSTPLAAVASSFDDVPVDASYVPAVDWLAETGITLGCTATTYCPDGTVTRAEMAAFLWRLEGAPEGSPASGFSDIPVGEKRYRDIPGAADDGGLVVDDELTAGHFPGGSCQPHFRPERVDETYQCAHQRPEHQQRYEP